MKKFFKSRSKSKSKEEKPEETKEEPQKENAENVPVEKSNDSRSGQIEWQHSIKSILGHENNLLESQITESIFKTLNDINFGFCLEEPPPQKEGNAEEEVNKANQAKERENIKKEPQDKANISDDEHINLDKKNTIIKSSPGFKGKTDPTIKRGNIKENPSAVTAPPKAPVARKRTRKNLDTEDSRAEIINAEITTTTIPLNQEFDTKEVVDNMMKELQNTVASVAAGAVYDYNEAIINKIGSSDDNQNATISHVSSDNLDDISPIKKSDDADATTNQQKKTSLAAKAKPASRKTPKPNKQLSETDSSIDDDIHFHSQNQPKPDETSNAEQKAKEEENKPKPEARKQRPRRKVSPKRKASPRNSPRRRNARRSPSPNALDTSDGRKPSFKDEDDEFLKPEPLTKSQRRPQVIKSQPIKEEQHKDNNNSVKTSQRAKQTTPVQKRKRLRSKSARVTKAQKAKRPLTQTPQNQNNTNDGIKTYRKRRRYHSVQYSRPQRLIPDRSNLTDTGTQTIQLLIDDRNVNFFEKIGSQKVLQALSMISDSESAAGRNYHSKARTIPNIRRRFDDQGASDEFEQDTQQRSQSRNLPNRRLSKKSESSQTSSSAHFSESDFSSSTTSSHKVQTPPSPQDKTPLWKQNLNEEIEIKPAEQRIKRSVLRTLPRDISESSSISTDIIMQLQNNNNTNNNRSRPIQKKSQMYGDYIADHDEAIDENNDDQDNNKNSRRGKRSINEFPQTTDGIIYKARKEKQNSPKNQLSTDISSIFESENEKKEQHDDETPNQKRNIKQPNTTKKPTNTLSSLLKGEIDHVQRLQTREKNSIDVDNSDELDDDEILLKQHKKRKIIPQDKKAIDKKELLSESNSDSDSQGDFDGTNDSFSGEKLSPRSRMNNSQNNKGRRPVKRKPSPQNSNKKHSRHNSLNQHDNESSATTSTSEENSESEKNSSRKTRKRSQNRIDELESNDYNESSASAKHENDNEYRISPEIKNSLMTAFHCATWDIAAKGAFMIDI